MRVQVTARHCQVPDFIRRRTDELVGKLTKYEPGISSAEVIFEEEKRESTVEIIVSIARAEPLVATGDGVDFRSALDKAVDRMSRMLRRRRDRITDHKGPRLSEGVSGD